MGEIVTQLLGERVFWGQISKCKGPEAGVCWVYSRNSKEVRVAGAEWVRRRVRSDKVRDAIGRPWQIVWLLLCMRWEP